MPASLALAAPHVRDFRPDVARLARTTAPALVSQHTMLWTTAARETEPSNINGLRRYDCAIMAIMKNDGVLDRVAATVGKLEGPRPTPTASRCTGASPHLYSALIWVIFANPLVLPRDHFIHSHWRAFPWRGEAMRYEDA